MNFAPGLEAGLSPVGLAAYDLVDSLSLRGSQYDEGEIVTPATAATDGFPVEEDGSLWEHPSINDVCKMFMILDPSLLCLSAFHAAYCIYIYRYSAIHLKNGKSSE